MVYGQNLKVYPINLAIARASDDPPQFGQQPCECPLLGLLDATVAVETPLYSVSTVRLV
jgi:hypothetical protein